MSRHADAWAQDGEVLNLRASVPLTIGDLPPKPTPTLEGQPVVWVELLSEGPLHYQGRKLDMDAAELERLEQAYQTMRGWGYLPPVLTEHDTDGERCGHVLDVKRWTHPDGRRLLIGALQLSTEGAADKLKNQQIYYFSPGLGPVEDPNTGTVLPRVVREVSRVSAPHRKTAAHVLGAEHNGGHPLTNGGVMDTENKAPEHDLGAQIEKMGEAIKAVTGKMEAMDGYMSECMARVEAMESSIKTMMEGAPAKEEGDDDNPEVEMGEQPSPELVELREQVARLQAERDTATMASFLSQRTGCVVDLSEDDAAAWLEIKTKAPSAFEALTGRVRKAKQEAKPAAPALPVNPFGSVALGESDVREPAPPTNHLTAKQVRAMAKDKGVNFLDLVAELREQGTTITREEV